MTRLLIKYSLEDEAGRVGYTLKKVSWYKEKGYKIILPEGLSENATDEEIRKAVERENGGLVEYEKYKEELERMWAEFAEEFEKMKKDLSLADSYTVVLTKYGTGGSYHSNTGTIEVRFTGRNIESIFGTILHEIVHIALEPLIKKYNIAHSQKERLVDLIGLKYFPLKRKAQEIKEDVSKVDESFNNFFPNLEEVVKGI